MRLAVLLLSCCVLASCQERPRDVKPASVVPAPVTAATLPVEVYFSPHGGCTEAVVRELDAAKQSVVVQAYSFTSPPIAKALVAAKERGVSIQVVLDKSQRSERYTEADFIAHHGIGTWIDAKHAIAHNKVIVVDSAVVITGSFNFTSAAENSNAENLLVLRDASLAAKYLDNFKAHLDHSEPYQPKGE